MSKRPLILISNDDSISAPGILRLVDYVHEMGDVIVVAPKEPQSGMSSAISVNKPLRICAHNDYCGARMFSVTGTPVDCIKLGLHAITPRRPDLVLAGINHGSNAGNSIIYSGTMGAVLEGCMVGIPSVGFSLLDQSMAADFSLAKSLIQEIVRKVLYNGLPNHICLNINIPAHIVPKGIRSCRAATGYWTEEYKRYVDPSGNPFYWLTGHFVNDAPDATDTDEYWLSQGYISLVPVAPDQTKNDKIEDFAKIYDE